MKYQAEIVSGLISFLCSGLLGLIVKYALDQSVKRIDDAMLRLTTVEKTIEVLRNNYSDIFNQFIMKFSQWEDRIKSLIINVDTKPVDLTSFDSMIRDVKSELEKMEEELKEVEDNFSFDLSNTDKRIMLQVNLVANKIKSLNSNMLELSNRINTFMIRVNSDSKSSSDQTSKLYFALKNLTTRLSSIETDLKNIKQIGNGKIKLF